MSPVVEDQTRPDQGPSHAESIPVTRRTSEENLTASRFALLDYFWRSVPKSRLVIVDSSGVEASLAANVIALPSRSSRGVLNAFPVVRPACPQMNLLIVWWLELAGSRYHGGEINGSSS